MAQRRLRIADFEQPALVVAPLLLGCILVKRDGHSTRRARIAEVEAYLGPKDLASHASKGRTNRTEVMFGPAGRAYVYFVYGLHFMLNVVVGATGNAEAILIRAAEPLDGWDVDLTGPAKLAKNFGITAAENRESVCGDPLHFLADSDYAPRIKRTRRIGIDYAKHWRKRLLRFIDANSPVASRLRMPK